MHVPRAREAPIVERLLWVFLMSFAFDYRSSSNRAAGGGTGLDQMLFLGLCIGSSLAILWLGRRHLGIRPGALVVGLWGLFLAYMMANSLLQGVPPGRSIRIALPLVFCFFGMANAHIAACMGIGAAAIVRPVWVCACINILWRIFHGFAFQDASVETVRFEVQSPANSWLAAWIGCAILLRGRFHWSVMAACAVLFLGVFITITRSLFFPIAASAAAACFCFLLCLRWGLTHWTDLGKRLIPVGAAAAVMLVALAIAAVVEPVMIERWNERLFHNADARNLGADISYLTRKAEADAIWTILEKEPVHFINGRGMGCSYYWDPAYLTEIRLVIPLTADEVDDIWFAGHSIWTYSLLSGGVIALGAFLGLLAGTGWAALLGARANASDAGPDQWLAFLPFCATCCLLSETLTSNPFQERLTGILFGVMAGLPQAFMVRASWIHMSNRPSPS